jgi:hypothetical protein
MWEQNAGKKAHSIIVWSRTFLPHDSDLLRRLLFVLFSVFFMKLLKLKLRQHFRKSIVLLFAQKMILSPCFFHAITLRARRPLVGTPPFWAPPPPAVFSVKKVI